MLDKSAIEAITEAQAIDSANAALLAAVEHEVGSIALPAHYTVHDLERYQPTRRHARGTMTTSVLEHFAVYVETHREPGATVFVDPESMRATAVLNLGQPLAPGHADNLAVLAPQRTAPYAALLAQADGRPRKQQEAAEWLEDWAVYVSCFGEDGQEIAARKAIAALRRLTIDAGRRVESEVGRLAASSSALDSVRASSAEPIPVSMLFVCAPYSGLKQRSFAVRVGILTTDKPAVVLRLINHELAREEMAQELAEMVTTQFEVSADHPDHPEHTPVCVGSYKAGA